jgi:hypothetical protein
MAVFTGINAMASVASTIAVNIPGTFRVPSFPSPSPADLFSFNRLLPLPEADSLRLDSDHRHAEYVACSSAPDLY